ncbi:hypothetical protein KGF54_003085 [Candida jiufengensis]|uniref:uncharacterized protein n=1 Tax=Candida jiufengensis TaxID=497108 RepID=UPI0022251187|nr:uncharacterized protein KGF54_003085 [Candida jiufengensis]KAI5953713.1 hypothetical protein KGF54_003085 [Candida jiufengensis]
MKWIVITLIFLEYVFALPDQSQSCITNINVPFTGYKIEYQLNLKLLKGTYHLLYCNDNKLIYDLNLNESIPWTKPLIHNNKDVNSLTTDKTNLVMARRKSFVLRDIPIFLPNTLVGSIFFQNSPIFEEIKYQNYTINSHFKSMPLLASNFLRNWCELNYKLNFIYHVPILTTPNIDSKFYEFRNDKNNQFLAQSVSSDWNKYISINENYNFKIHDSRKFVRQSFDSCLNKINNLITNQKVLDISEKFKNSKLIAKVEHLYLNLVFVSKLLTQLQFNSLLIKIDKFLNSI